jgi:hypothetical protein
MFQFSAAGEIIHGPLILLALLLLMFNFAAKRQKGNFCLVVFLRPSCV